MRPRISASRLMRSTTLRFVAGGLRHLLAHAPPCRGARRQRRSAAGRVFDSPRPAAHSLRADGSRRPRKAGATDSLLKRYGAAKRWSEALAFATARHVFTVNEGIQAALVAAHPGLAGKSGVLPAPVDTRIFTPAPFPETDAFRLVYAGRFDEVKDPALMFETVAALARRLDGCLEFHVIGSASPEAFPEFAAIRHLDDAAWPEKCRRRRALIREAHCGILTRIPKGCPAFCWKRWPLAGRSLRLRLPTFEAHVVPGVTGQLTDAA